MIGGGNRSYWCQVVNEITTGGGGAAGAAGAAGSTLSAAMQ